jgi:hypothetical protein
MTDRRADVSFTWPHMIIYATCCFVDVQVATMILLRASLAIDFRTASTIDQTAIARMHIPAGQSVCLNFEIQLER